MKVLWFTNTTSLYRKGLHSYHGGGWIESLEETIRSCSEIELAVAFYHPFENTKVIQNGVVYYPIRKKSARSHPIKGVFRNWFPLAFLKINQDYLLDILEDFKPDIIHVFGTEQSFALIQELTDIPVLVHLQGILNPYLHAYYPVGHSGKDFILNYRFFFENIIGSSPFFGLYQMKAHAEIEKRILSKLKYVCGRTEWDRMISNMYNSEVKYFHIDEVLRSIFYEKCNGELYIREKSACFTILSTLSPTLYKGIDVIMRVAKLMNELCKIQFEWRVIGLESSSKLLRFFEGKLGVSHESLNIKFLGKIDSYQIAEEIHRSDVFVHPSYIDNSPNSVCEAQMLGKVVIACDVGGLSTLIKHNKTGFLVPSNGIYELIHYIKVVHEQPDLCKQIGKNAMTSALNRHSRDKIKFDLINVYKSIGERKIC